MANHGNEGKRDILEAFLAQRPDEELAELEAQKWRVTATVAGQVAILLGVVAACLLLLRAFDAEVARAEGMRPWCLWHLKYGVGGVLAASVVLGLAAGVAAIVSEKRHLPGDGSVGNECIAAVVAARTRYFFPLGTAVTAAMSLYGAWHVMSTLGWAVATFAAAPLVALECFVFGNGARVAFLLFGIVLWFRHCPAFARMQSFFAKKKEGGDDNGGDVDDE